MKIKTSGPHLELTPYGRAALRRYARFCLTIVLPSTLFFALVMLLFSDPAPDDLDGRLKSALAVQDHAKAIEVYREKLEQDPLNRDLHFKYIYQHFEGTSIGKKKLKGEYLQMAKSDDPEAADIGHWALGTIGFKRKEYAPALRRLEKVENQDQKYQQYILAQVYLGLKKPEQAIDAFQREIDSGGFLRGACWRLARLYQDRGQWDQIAALAQDEALGPHVPNDLRRWLALQQGHLLRFAFGPVEALGRSLNPAGLIAASLILAAWLVFLLKIDIFEPEKPRSLLAAALLGALVSLLAVPIYDLLRFGLGFHEGKGAFQDLLFCIFGIGLIEESIKLIPLAVFLRFSRQVNESIDYLLYGAAGALGFAFAENLLYFDEYSFKAFHVRGMLCASSHMFYTAIVAYGLMVAIYRRSRHPRACLALVFFIACSAHGLFDFFLMRGGALVLMSLGIEIYCMLCFNRILNNALNQSEFYQPGHLNRLNRLRQYLAYSLTGILLFEFAAIAWVYGPLAAASTTPRFFIFSWPYLYFLAFTLGNYELRPRVWMPVAGDKVKELITNVKRIAQESRRTREKSR